MRKSLMILFVLCLLLGGCTKNTEINSSSAKSEEVITIVLPKSPASLPVIRMIEAKVLGDDVKVDLQLYTDMEQMMTIAVADKYSYLGVPVHTGAILKNKGLDVKLLNVMLWGGMYLCTTDSECKGWEDIKGKRLFVPAKGSVPDIITRYFLQEFTDIRMDEIDIIYSNHVEIAQLIKGGKAKYFVDVQPFVTFNKNNVDNYKIVSDYHQDWKKAAGDKSFMPNFGILVREQFSNKNQENLKIFNRELEKAIEWTVNNPKEAGELAEKYLKANSELVEKAIPNFYFAYKDSAEVRRDIEKYCEALFIFKPESIGGKLPDEEFYYKN